MRNGKADGRCGGVADRVQPRRRPRLQRRARRRGTAGRAGRAVHRRASGRIPDAGAMEGRPARPAAGRGDDDGRDPGTGRRHLADDVRRPLRACDATTSAATWWRIRNAPPCWPARVARMVALRRKARAERKIAVVLFNFPPNAGTVGTAAYPVGLPLAAQHVMLGMKAAGYTSTCRSPPTRCASGCWAATPQFFGTNANVAARMPADDHVRRQRWLDEIEAQWGPAPGAHPDRRRVAVRAGRAFRQRVRRRAAGLRLRRRPDAPAVRARLRADACVLRVLSLAQPGIRRRRGAAFRHPRRAGIHARQAGRHVRQLLARPADRRPAEFLPLCLEQPVRGHDRQAPRRRVADQLPDAAGVAMPGCIAGCWT